jgi:hypothetical protein
MALGAAASVPLAVVLFSIESVSRRRHSKRGKNRAPRPLWRGFVGIYSLIGGGALETIAGSEPLQVRQHPYLFVAVIPLEVIAVAALIWNLQYSRRLQRQTPEAPSNGVGSL